MGGGIVAVVVDVACQSLSLSVCLSVCRWMCVEQRAVNDIEEISKVVTFLF